jgi:twitching motility protein PilT
MRKGDKVFGDLAVELGLLSEQKLAACVKAMQHQHRGKRLIDLCRDLDLLSADEIKFVMQNHKRKVERTWASAGGGAAEVARQGERQRFRRTGTQPAVKPRSRKTEIPIAIDLDLDLDLDLDDAPGDDAPGDHAPGEDVFGADVFGEDVFGDFDQPAAGPDDNLPASLPESGEEASFADVAPLEAPLPPTVREQTRSRITMGVVPVVTRQPVARKDPAQLAAIDVLLKRMVEADASDLHLSAGCSPMMRCHGAMQQLEGVPAMKQEELCKALLEIAPARSQDEFATTNDADFAYAIEGLARFRANYFVDRRGMGAVFRQIPMGIMTPEQLGLPPKVLELCELTKGLVLVTGPTGSGKSTTLATLVDVINRSRDDHIITIEDPIEFVHENKRCLVNQREVGAHTRSFKVALRAALREDPDIVLVGELRDLETIAIAIETAETGHLVFGTLHTTTAPSTVDRVIDQFPSDRQAQIRTMLSGSLRGVIAQVLCQRRGGGRVAAYEILMGNAAVANLIREGKSHQLPSVMQTGRSRGMQTLNDHLIELVRQGAVDPREAFLKASDKQGLQQQLAQAGVQLDD